MLQLKYLRNKWLRRTKKIPDDDEGAVVATQDYVKLVVVYNFIDADLGQHMIRDHVPGASDSMRVRIGLGRVMEVTSTSGITRHLNRYITVGSNSIFVHTYTENTSGRLHEALLSKMSNVFFGGLSAGNPFPRKSRVRTYCRQEFERQVEEGRDYYR